jgi:hypothetical protein
VEGSVSSTRIRRTHVRQPANICLACFNAQQQFRFPFLIYCAHHGSLALVHSADDSSTFACAPAQLNGLLAKLGSGLGGGVASPAKGDGAAPPAAQA